MAKRTLNLDVRDSDQQLITDPVVFVRLANQSGAMVSEAKIALKGAALKLEFEDAPADPVLILRVSPSRYVDVAVPCTVNGDGEVLPKQPICVPRRSSEWQPVCTPWGALPDAFTALRTCLEESPALKVGRHSPPGLFVGAAYDGVEVDDESRMLAKLCLLNLYSRLRSESAPGHQRTWFSMIERLLLATRERIMCQVMKPCWTIVHELAAAPPKGFRKTNAKNHKRNFEDLPGVTAVDGLASIKTRDDTANLQFTVATARLGGRKVHLLDADMDENGSLLLHTYDFLLHNFNGGTHPIDIHESLRVMFPGTDLGYTLEPEQPVGVVEAKILTQPAGG